jgi:excisionase family DNA binding protein
LKKDAEKEYLTIKEAADILGISRQAVYNKLDNEFTPYLTIENGKKLLNTAVL